MSRAGTGIGSSEKGAGASRSVHHDVADAHRARGGGRGGRSGPCGRGRAASPMRPVPAFVGADPQVLEGGRPLRRWWRSRARRRAASRRAGSASGSPIQRTRNGSSSFSSSMKPRARAWSPDGIDHRPSKEAPSTGTTHDDDGHRGQPGRDLPPAEAVAGQVDLEGDDTHGGREGQAGGGGHEEHVDRRAAATSKVPRCATHASPNDSDGDRPAAHRPGVALGPGDQERERRRHEEAPAERARRRADRSRTGAARPGRTLLEPLDPPVNDSSVLPGQEEVERPRQVEQHRDRRPPRPTAPSRRRPPRGFTRDHPAERRGRRPCSTTQHDGHRRDRGGQGGDEARCASTRSRHGRRAHTGPGVAARRARRAPPGWPGRASPRSSGAAA